MAASSRQAVKAPDLKKPRRTTARIRYPLSSTNVKQRTGARAFRATLRTRRRPVSRILFHSDSVSPSDTRQEIRSLAEAVQRKSKREFRQKWNFDIDEEKPLEGKYKWET